MLDEIQMAKPKVDRSSGVKVTVFDVLNGLNNNPNVDIYVTGSNSKMLSKDILTEFRGRTTQIRVHPLSFKEYYSFVGGNVDEVVKEYLVYGGMPELMYKTDETAKKEYLIDLFDKTYLKDIVERNKVTREDVLEDVMNYLASVTASLTNKNNIANALSSKRNQKIHYDMVSNYIDYSLDSFLINEAKRYDVRGKCYFDYPSKFYFEDIGLRNARLQFRQLDKGHLMENVIYNELIRRGYLVDVAAVTARTKTEKEYLEIDFIVNNIDQKVYIQSAFEIESADKLQQETKSLSLTTDNFKKILLRNDIIKSFYDDSGIFNLSLTDFLLEKVSIF